MTVALKAKSETLRQASVERLQLIGIPLEESFERVTRLAARLLALPTAAFSFSDGERQLLKASVGFSKLRNPERIVTLNERVVEEDSALLIEDASADERFAQNKLVTGPQHIRFFAGVPVRSPSLQPVGALCVMHTRAHKASGEELRTLTDLAAIIERELVLRALLRTDPLTGLYNRQHFEVEVAREWRRASRSKSPISAMLVNIDQMGEYNDTYGQTRGDAALRHVAEHLAQRFLRSSDLLVRWGGDEFLIVLPEAGDAAAGILAEEIRRLVEALDIAHPCSRGPCLTVSIGCASTEPDQVAGEPHRALLAAARAALLEAKAAGRNCVRLAAQAVCF